MRKRSKSGAFDNAERALVNGARARTLSICLVLIGVTWLVFGQTLHFDFVNYDDDRYVYKNGEITSGLTVHGIVWAFTHSHGGNWHPVTTLSHMADCQLFGLNAGAHHFVNVFYHCIVVLLLFLVLRAMTGSVWRSAFVAAIFAIHPLRAESVAWISERKDVLSGIFFMLTLAAYLGYVRRSSIGRYLLTLALFAIGLMSKPMLVTLPFVLLLLDYWPLERLTDIRELRRRIVEKVPFFLLSAASCVATILAQGRAIASVDALPAPIRVGNAFVTYLIYIWQMIWPMRLAVFYPYPQDESLWELVVALTLLAVITIGVMAVGRRQRYLVTGWFWYLIMLVPVIGFVQVGVQARADRYTYLPQIGVYFLITWWAADVFASRRNRTIIFAPLAAIVLLALAWLGWTQTSYWRDSESLWAHAIAVTSGNFVAQNDLGNYLLDHNRIDEAIDQFQASTRINPNFFDAETNLGAALRAKGQTDEAIVHFEKALELQPAESASSKYAATHNNLGVALTAVERPSEAIAHFHQALELNPNESKTYYNLGNALMQTGQLDEAIGNYEKALAIQPHYAYAHHNLGTALAEKGETEAAEREFQKAKEDTPH